MPKQRALVLGLIVLGVVIVGFFGLRTVRAFRKFHGHHPPSRGHIETDVQKIQDWMTIPFIARMYRVPEPVLFEAVGIPEQGNGKKSLKELNTTYFPDADGIVLQKIKTAIQMHQQSPPP